MEDTAQDPQHLHLPEFPLELERTEDFFSETPREHVRHVPGGRNQGLDAPRAPNSDGMVPGRAQVRCPDSGSFLPLNLRNWPTYSR